MMDGLSDGQLAALAGAVGGGLLGLAARLGGFCTMGAIEDYLHGEDDTRLRMWGLAISLSVVGSALLAAMGLFDPAQSFYLASGWSPAASIVGGLMFGYGMALTGHCCHGALARLGGGDMRAFVTVIVIGVSAYMAMSGPTSVPRTWLFETEPGTSVQGLPALIETVFGAPSMLVWLGIGVIGTVVVLTPARFRRERQTIFWSLVIAAAICSGWLVTQWIADTGFSRHPVVSHSYAAPTGESLVYLMTMRGTYIDFGIGSVFGVIGGACLGCLWQGQFRWEGCEDPREIRRQVFGAFLMGTGAVVALGCSVGQGLSAFSILAPSAPVVMISIFAGAALGLRVLIDDAPLWSFVSRDRS